MSDKISILLQTADRSNYTIRAVNSFLNYNNPDDFDLYVIDDASRDLTGVNYAVEKGFNLIHSTTNQRVGCTVLLRQAIEILDSQLPGESKILYWQNDCDFVRPLPIALINKLFLAYKVDTIRLYGKRKSRRRDLHGPTQDRKRKKWDIKYIDDEKLGFSVAKWAHQPNITKLKNLALFFDNAKNEKDIFKVSLQNNCYTASFENNVAFHFGNKKTPKGRYGRKSEERKKC